MECPRTIERRPGHGRRALHVRTEYSTMLWKMGKAAKQFLDHIESVNVANASNWAHGAHHDS